MPATGVMTTATRQLERAYSAFLLLGGIFWAADLPHYFGIPLIEAEWLGPYLAVAIAAAYLSFPYGKRAGPIEILLGFAAIAAWLWMSANYNAWLLDFAGYTPAKYLPGVVAIVVMMEALRKACGLPITILVWLLIAYGLWGHLMPPPFQAENLPVPNLVMYIYADTNAIPGLVLVIIASLVLAFIVLGKLMEVSGATQFFTDMALAAMGHRRGGPAKVAIVASSLFGTISGSPVANIMSTGVVTIPLMKRTGFKPHYAAAIEAVASTGGQIAPPVMGATAFLIAEFLQIGYIDVVIAAVVPALLYYFCLFMQVDAIAARQGLAGIPRAELPRAGPLVRRGWLFVVPLALLIYLLFWKGYNPSTAALASAGLMFVFAVLRGRMRDRKDWADFIFGGGANMVPLVLIGAGAGVVIGVMNITGLGQSLSFVLVHAGQNAGLLAMLAITALLAIVLGMGMPTAAIYVVLSIILAPPMVEMGMTPLAAHMFIFYFGVLSFLTPPVAVSSFVAAGLAGSNMWRTGWVGMQLSAIAYLLPFLWAYDPAILMDGSPLAIVLVFASAVGAILMFARGIQVVTLSDRAGALIGTMLFAAALAVGTSPIWLGAESLLNLVPALGALAVYLVAPGSRAATPGLISRGTRARDA